MEVTVKIEGLEKLRIALQEAGPKLAKKAVRKALKAGAEVFIEGVKSRAPVLKEGTPQRRPGELRDSIDMNIKLSAKEEKGTATIGPRTEKGKGSQQPGVYGMFVEFGSIHGAAQPYMRPGYEASRDRALDVVQTVLRDSLEVLKKTH